MRLGTRVAAALLVGSLVAATPSYAAPAPVDRPAVIERVVIGHSVQGRPITAWHLGQPGKQRVLLISTMHGDEGKPRQILGALRDGRPIRGVDLWVVPVYNPDGLARGTRKNAHGVDLNRNFPYRWADLDGSYESGQRPGSEPETRALAALVDDTVEGVVAVHAPFACVNYDGPAAAWAEAIAVS